MENPNLNPIDWTLPLDKLPEQVRLADLPPLFRLIVERNVELRRRIRDCQQKLAALNADKPLAEAAAQRFKDPGAVADSDRLRDQEQIIRDMRAQIAALEGKLENFRGMLERRDQKIAKLEKKR